MSLFGTEGGFRWLEETIEITYLFYLVGIPIWLWVWKLCNGYNLMRPNRLLFFPFLLSLIFLTANFVLILVFGEIGSIEYEEGRFNYIVSRASIAVQASASILIVATIVYGLTIKRVPVDFIRFMVYAFIFILGVMAPILWVPIELPEMFFILRHVQTIALNFGLMLCVAGIVMLLRDLLTHGHATVNFVETDPMGMPGLVGQDPRNSGEPGSEQGAQDIHSEPADGPGASQAPKMASEHARQSELKKDVSVSRHDNNPNP